MQVPFFLQRDHASRGTRMPGQPSPPPTPSELRKDRHRATVARIADAHLSAMGGTLADTIGHDSRQRLVWLALLAMPLLFPVALPGMGSAVGVFCLVIAFGSSSNLASAYGIAVTGDMVITTILASILFLKAWKLLECQN